MNWKITISLSVLLLSLNLAGLCQKKALTFDILRDDKTLGKIFFSQTSLGKKDSLNMECKVNAKLISTISAEARETAVFSDGVLVQSSIYRKMNGTQKANKSQRAVNGKYLIADGKKSKEINIYPITQNMLSLYTNEPINTRQVYSDNFEVMVPVDKIEDHKYKVTLPDNSYNYYYYKGDTLNEVEVHHPLYSARFVLRSKE